MRWIVATGVLVAFGLPVAFTAGIVVALDVAAGAKPTETLNDVLGSAGDWVGGLASFMAAWVALRIAARQRQDELPSLAVDVSGSYSISVTNFGKLPVDVDGHWLYLTSKYGTFLLSPDLDDGDAGSRLEHGKRVTFRYGDQLALNMASWIHTCCHRDIRAVSLVISTPFKAFKFPLPDYLELRINAELERFRR